MKQFVRSICGLLGAYFFAWSTAYLIMLRGEGSDFRLYFEYLRLAWTFDGGELPTFIWFLSVGGFIPLGIFVILIMRYRERRARKAP